MGRGGGGGLDTTRSRGESHYIAAYLTMVEDRVLEARFGRGDAVLGGVGGEVVQAFLRFEVGQAFLIVDAGH